MKLDLLAFGAHPDDVELGCGGTIAKQIHLGNKVGIVDLTQSELSSRGTIATRQAETDAASKILGIHSRDNLGFADGFFINDKVHQLEIIKMIRHYKPGVVLTNALIDRHPDHGRGHELVRDACFLAGLSMIETTFNGEKQSEWRPRNIHNYIQSYHIEPQFVVDISGFEDIKMNAVLAYSSQFYNPNSQEKDTFISSKEFLDFIKSRMVQFGQIAGFKYAEGFTTPRYIGVDDLMKLY
ncbi:MAG: bacillithiol biosynthesis deacetylase BshB1 [Bacteroidota bacterium]